jgi:hypothetical protein
MKAVPDRVPLGERVLRMEKQLFQAIQDLEEHNTRLDRLEHEVNT